MRKHNSAFVPAWALATSLGFNGGYCNVVRIAISESESPLNSAILSMKRFVKNVSENILTDFLLRF